MDNIKDIKKKDPKSLVKPLCMDNPEIQAAEYHDHYIDGVTYRVWSAFEGKTKAEKSLGELMLRRLESGEDIEEVVDEYELEIQRINEETCKFFDDDADMSEEEIMLLDL